MTTTDNDTCRCGHVFDQHDPIDEQYAGACSECDCAEFFTPPRAPECIDMRITFTANQLPDDHPAWTDDRGTHISRRWWDVVVEKDGVTYTGTESWHHLGELQVIDVAHRVMRPERPSEKVMRMLDERKENER